MTPEQHARALALTRHGVIHRDELKAAGLSDKQIHNRVVRGDLVRVLPAVYRLGEAPASFAALVHAAQAWLGPTAALTGPAAAFWLGLDGVEEPARVTVLCARSAPAPGWLELVRCRPGEQPRGRWLQGVRLCAIERVLLDCAAPLPAAAVGSAADDAIRLRLTTPARLAGFAAALGRGCRGKQRLQQVLLERTAAGGELRSIFEAKAFKILRRIPGIDVWPDHSIEAGGRAYVIDFFIPQAALGIECHSYRWHMGKHDYDARRDRAIKAAGVELLYFTWNDVVARPATVERDVRAAIRRRTSSFAT